MYQELADMACERITAAITRAQIGTRPVKAVTGPLQSRWFYSSRQLYYYQNAQIRDRRESLPASIGLSLDSGWEARILPRGGSSCPCNRVRQESQSRA